MAAFVKSMFSKAGKDVGPVGTTTPAASEDAQETSDKQKLEGVACPAFLDLVFCCDATGSMGSYIHSAQQNIQNIVERIVANEKTDVRFGLVSYRDHPPQDSTYVTRKFDFTSSLRIMRANVDTMSASGGGDGPEAVCCGLHDCLGMDWRKEATKIVVWIADAPPHGLGESGDGFPNGCVDGHDPLATARLMAERGITVYSVGCEPALGSYRFARDFMVSVAKITNGQAVLLGSAALLVDVILGGASEEIALDKLLVSAENDLAQTYTEVAAERMAAGAAPELSEEDEGYAVYEEQVNRKLWSKLAAKGVKTKQMTRDGAMETPFADDLCKASGLASWRSSEVMKCAAPAPGFLGSVMSGGSRASSFGAACGRAGPAPGGCGERRGGGGAPSTCSSDCYDDIIAASAAPPPRPSTTVRTEENVVTYEQVTRLVGKGRSRAATSRPK